VDEARAVVWGVLYEIGDDDWLILDRYESDYSRFACQVYLKANQRVPAEVYLWTGQGPEIPPLDWYRDHMLEGAREHELPPDHIRLIERLAR